ncbi:SpoIIE family protein phosphatase [Spirulina subsalsa FACHB-351]|uniref:SpoIIE family protein phosphatase n=1 Tax=Spirulina subsalsa FACHB-351 TaxID=234711 RepID=A0ABT3L727_9CYAN|nr:SpoIIE family protein phosphatase [Spirulina subsalsa]MCW6036987.1 SpoIIE family protein phosphatase [Spirulina subsalsa FACHB-351]
MENDNQASALSLVDYSIFGRPCFGERVSGDQALIDEKDGIIFLGIIDALGHGKEAHQVSALMQKFLHENWTFDVRKTLLNLHEHCKGTLGAAVGLGLLNVQTGELSYSGVGNTVIRLVGKQSKRLYSADGIVGSRMRTPVEQKLYLTPTDILLMYTDGVKDRFEVNDYPQLLYESPQALARNIVRQFEKVYDDATCLVLRYKK